MQHGRLMGSRVQLLCIDLSVYTFGYVYTPPPIERSPGEAHDPLLAFCHNQRPGVGKMQAQVDIRSWLLKQNDWLQEAADRLLKKGEIDALDVADLTALIKTPAGSTCAHHCNAQRRIAVGGVGI